MRESVALTKRQQRIFVCAKAKRQRHQRVFVCAKAKRQRQQQQQQQQVGQALS
ncbi:hypothetical protein [Lysinibacillus xylanilyticus]|uniref:hypothetical protein n=1 Tax=Lysinibacillus xylanilyticus TaxID=582475 RepID=UPI003806AD2D